MRSRQKPSTQRKHNTLRDCQSRDPQVSDNVVAHKKVIAANIQTSDLKTKTLQSENTSVQNIAIRGQTDLPDDWDEQLFQYFSQKGKPFKVPRMVVDSLVINNMLLTKGTTSFEHLSIDGTMDVRGGLNCFGSVNAFSSTKLHGPFEVDQDVVAKPKSSLQDCMTNALSTPVVVKEGPQKEDNPTMVRCKQLQTNQIKVKDKIETNKIQAQSAFCYSQQTNELTSQSIQAEKIQSKRLESEDIRVDRLCVEKQLGAPSILANEVDVNGKVKTNSFEAKRSVSEEAIYTKLSVKQAEMGELTSGKLKVDNMSVKKNLEVLGEVKLNDSLQCLSSVHLKDTLSLDGAFSLKDRLESKIGQPIQCKQAVQFHQPICLANYQYVYFNTPQSSLSKPFQIEIGEDKNCLVVDSDVSNILSLEVKLPTKPVRGQLIGICCGPSISSIVIRGSGPLYSGNMSMGSYLQFLFIEEVHKWFRTG